jgi:hypothetical protein
VRFQYHRELTADFADFTDEEMEVAILGSSRPCAKINKKVASTCGPGAKQYAICEDASWKLLFSMMLRHSAAASIKNLDLFNEAIQVSKISAPSGFVFGS